MSLFSRTGPCARSALSSGLPFVRRVRWVSGQHKYSQAVCLAAADNDGGLSGIALRFLWTVKLNLDAKTRSIGDNPDLPDPEG